MRFKGTEYKLENVKTGRVFEDEGWTLADPQCSDPSLVRAVYKNKKFTPREDLDGLYRYADWMPINRTLRRSSAPVTYKSNGLAKFLGLENLYITFSGYNPRIGAKMKTCSFKETEAYTVLARMSKKEKRVLIVQSAGNTARAFAQVCSDNRIPVVICIPEDSKHDLWFRRRLDSCVKVVAVPHGCDYYDAISVGEKLAQSDRYFLEGGAKNVARRDGMGTTILSCVEKMGRIPDAYFQAVGSGTGAIAAWENAERLAADGRFGENKMKVFVSQNIPFTLMYDSWKADSRALLELSPEQGRRNAEVILAKVLANRKPPYSLAGGLYDVLKASNGDVFKISNDDIVYWILQFRNLEGYDLLPASCTAVAALAQALNEGKVKKDDYIMLNCTGGGTLISMARGYVVKQPDLILSPDLPAEEIIAAVNSLF
ncbi:MAG: cysteate synthase [Bacteroidales bacterium]|nr:cysteate synthase [Candidatus Cryptobacteroides equifaecalis]